MRLVLFDCDGTLVDSQHIIIAAMRQAYGSLGLPSPEDSAIRDIIGLSLPDAVSRLSGEGSPHPIPDLVQAYKDAYFIARSSPDFHEPLFPGLRELLDALREKDDWLLGVATGKSRRGLLSVLQHHGLRDHFITLQTADDAPSKPHPGMALRAMEETGASPQETLLIGDTSFDMMLAKAAGIGALGVTWGYHPATVLLSAGADALVHKSGDLLPLLDQWWN